MVVKILHLYSNLMNLYGEYANVSILQRHLNEQGLECEICKTDSCKDVNFFDYDLIYIGSGTEKAQKRALADLMTKKDEFTAAADSGKLILLTGNAFEMIGKSITDAYGNRFEAICLSPFETVESYDKRLTGDAVFTCKFIPEKFVGFINKCSFTSGVDKPLFSALMGIGNDKDDRNEGVRYKNVFGTHLIGPLLVKNPHFAGYIIQLLTKDIKGFEYKETISQYEQEAYQTTLKELCQRTTEA